MDGTHLLSRNRILHQNQMRQPIQTPQRIQIRQLGHIIRGQNNSRQIRQRRSQCRLNMLDPVPC